MEDDYWDLLLSKIIAKRISKEELISYSSNLKERDEKCLEKGEVLEIEVHNSIAKEILNSECIFKLRKDAVNYFGICGIKFLEEINDSKPYTYVEVKLLTNLNRDEKINVW